jgi:dTDP-glucose pyrophosphorylase
MKTLVIPAAGLATRLRPLTDSTSKAMIKVGGRYVIDRILSLVRSYYDKILVVVRARNNDLDSYLVYKYPEVQTVVQSLELPGPLGAVMSALNLINDGSVTIWLGDTIVDGVDLGSLDFTKNFIVTTKTEDYEPWCIYDKATNTYWNKSKVAPPIKEYQSLIGIYNLSQVPSPSEIDCGDGELVNLLEKYTMDVISIPSHCWIDTGNLENLHSAHTHFLEKSTRPHNQLRYNNLTHTMTKFTSLAELNWYDQGQKDPLVRKFTPTVYDIDYHRSTLELEYVSGETLDNILLSKFITNSTREYILHRVLTSYKYVFDRNVVKHNMPVYEMFCKKNIDRISKYDKPAHEKEIIIEFCNQFQNTKADIVRYVHGDFHLGNILFDVYTGGTKFIDPRGSWDGFTTTNGCVLYDLAKFQQSIFAEYAWIYNLEPVDQDVKASLQFFTDKIMTNLWSEEVVRLAKYLSIVLLAAAVPFHNENSTRQDLIWKTVLDIIESVNHY